MDNPLEGPRGTEDVGATPPSPYATPPSPYAAAPVAYPAAPYSGSPAPSTSKNWQGVVSLVLSLSGFGIPGIVLGILGISSANKGTADNKGIAIAGLVISSMSALLVMGLIIAAIVSDNEESSSGKVDHVATGQCFNEPNDGGRGVEEGETYEVEGFIVVDCTEAHYAQVYFTGDLPDGPYPGEEAVVEDVFARCDALWEVHIDQNYFEELYESVLFPLSAQYALGDREFQCLVVASDDGDLFRSYVNGSLAETSGADAEQPPAEADDRAQVEIVAFGDCFDETSVPRPRGIDDVGGFVLLECENAHEAQVYYSGLLPGDTYMGTSEAAEYVSQTCEEQFAAHVRDGGPKDWRVSYYYNDALMFMNGMSNFECAVRSADGPLTGSWVVAS